MDYWNGGRHRLDLPARPSGSQRREIVYFGFRGAIKFATRSNEPQLDRYRVEYLLRCIKNLYLSAKSCEEFFVSLLLISLCIESARDAFFEMSFV